MVSSNKAPVPGAGDESAALLNQFTAIDRNLIDSAPPIRRLKPKKASKLKRLSHNSGPLYRGIGGAQRRLVSSRLDQFEVDDDFERPPDPARNVRAPSVDPALLNWQVQDTTQNSKKRKLKSRIPEGGETPGKPIPRRPRKDRTDAPPERMLEAPQHTDSPTNQVPALIFSKRGRGRPRKNKINEALITVSNQHPVVYINSGDAVRGKTGVNGETEGQEISNATSRNPKSPQSVIRKRKPSNAIHTSRRSPRPEMEQNEGPDKSGEVSNDSSHDAYVSSTPRSSTSELFISDGPSQTARSRVNPSSAQPPPTQSRQRGTHLPGLSEAVKSIGNLGLKRENRQNIRCPLPKVDSDKARMILEACEDVELKLSHKDRELSVNASGQVAGLEEYVMAVSDSVTTVFGAAGWDSIPLVRDLALHVVPRLVRLLRTLVKSYPDNTISGLTSKQLQLCHELVRATIEVASGVSKAASTVKLQFPYKGIIKDVASKMQQDLKLLDSEILAVERIENARKWARINAERTRQEEETRTRSDEIRKKLEEWKEYWASLHFERLRVEQTARFLHPSKLSHLRLIPLDVLDTNIELDSNGVPFERVEAFLPRHTKLPINGIMGNTQVWPEEHSYVLLKALKEYAGPNVYRKLFWKHCIAGGTLNRYNVSEIVEQAVWLRDEFIKTAEEGGAAVESWLTHIADPRVPPDTGA
ncbi:hypothetical protein AAFC00_006344 [Neodothiora populina]|uniref:Uncharacterized protein n=1 Tax=Neodothiora populina TaxID=2781224 RepID=A0ABR3P6B0_9PEZI